MNRRTFIGSIVGVAAGLGLVRRRVEEEPVKAAPVKPLTIRCKSTDVVPTRIYMRWETGSESPVRIEVFGIDGLGREHRIDPNLVDLSKLV